MPVREIRERNPPPDRKPKVVGYLIDIRHRRRRYRVRSPGETKGDAQAHEAYLRGELARHGTLDHLDAEPASAQGARTFAEFSEHWMSVFPHERRNRASEIANKRSILRSHLLPAFGTRRLDEISGLAIATFKADAAKRGLSGKTLNNVLTVLRCILESATEWGELAEIPRIRFAKIARPDFRFLSEDEARALLGATDQPLGRAAILLGWHAGLRWGEISALSWDDVSFERRQLKIRQAWSKGKLEAPKNGIIRYVPMTETLAGALMALRRTGPFVLMLRGSHLVRETSLLHLKAMCRKAGIKPHGWHVLRHTFASHLVQRGVPLVVIQHLLGHSSIRMTERYAHLRTQGTHDDAGFQAEQAVALLEQPRPNHGHPVGTHVRFLDVVARGPVLERTKTPLG
jgi:integrase